jgi:membrane protein YdbS with pleckstrin-like domain
MWDSTAWAVATWLKGTLILAVAVAGCWWWFGTGSGALVLAVLVAVLAEIHLTRLLIREWTHEASLHWWWGR